MRKQVQGVLAAVAVSLACPLGGPLAGEAAKLAPGSTRRLSRL